MVRKRKKLQWAAVLWAKMPCWWHRSEENGQIGLSWYKGNIKSNNHSFTTEVCIRESLITQHIKSWGKWATAAENHIWCYSCQLRTGKWGNNLHRLTINDTRRSEKCCLVWWVLISTATLRWNGQNFASTTWKHGSTLPYINVSGWRYNGIWIFSWHNWGQLVPIYLCWNATAYPSIVAGS